MMDHIIDFFVGALIWVYWPPFLLFSFTGNFLMGLISGLLAWVFCAVVAQALMLINGDGWFFGK